MSLAVCIVGCGSYARTVMDDIYDMGEGLGFFLPAEMLIRPETTVKSMTVLTFLVLTKTQSAIHVFRRYISLLHMMCIWTMSKWQPETASMSCWRSL